MNKVILMGRLTRDPESRYTQANSSQESMCVARYTLAVDRNRNTQRKRTVFRQHRNGSSGQDVLLRELFRKLLETCERSPACQWNLSCESSSSVQFRGNRIRQHRNDRDRHIRRIYVKDGNGIRYRQNPDRRVRK